MSKNSLRLHNPLFLLPLLITPLPAKEAAQKEDSNLAKKFREEDIFVIALPQTQYIEQINALLNTALAQNNRLCYVSLTMPAKTLIKRFEEEGFDKKKIMIIDCVTKRVTKSIADPSIATYIDSPQNFTQLSITIEKALQNGTEFFFFDTLSTFMLYEKKFIVVRFIHDLISKIRLYNKKVAFLILHDHLHAEWTNDISMFVDDIIEL